MVKLQAVALDLDEVFRHGLVADLLNLPAVLLYMITRIIKAVIAVDVVSVILGQFTCFRPAGCVHLVGLVSVLREQGENGSLVFLRCNVVDHSGPLVVALNVSPWVLM